MILSVINKIKYLVIKRLGVVKGFRPNRSQLKNSKKNSNFWKQFFKESHYDGKSGTILSEFQSNFFMQCGVAILANFVARKYNSSIIYLSQGNRLSPLLRFYLSSFNKESHVLTINEITSQRRSEIISLSMEIFESLNSPLDILKITYKNILIGEFIYDSILAKTKAAFVEKLDKSVLVQIEKSITTLVACEIIDSRYKIRSCVLSHKVGSFYGPMISFTNLRKIETFLGIGGVGTIGKRQNIEHLKELPISQFRPPSRLVELGMKSKSITDRSEEYLKRRINGKVEGNIDADRAFNSQGKYFSEVTDFCTFYNIKYRPLVFVMLHAFNDYPHYERIIFDDYYHWLLETLMITSEIKDVNWIFKEHPSAVFWPDNLNLNELILEHNKHQNLVLLDHEENFNTACIKDIAHAVITCIGTAGLEFSCFGIPAILGGINHYSSYGITINNDSLADYRSSLLNISTIEKLDQRDILKAKVLFFLIEGVIRNVELYEILPKLGHDTRKSSNSGIMNSIVDSYDKESSKSYIVRLNNFVMSDNPDGFINDVELYQMAQSLEGN